MPRTKVVFYREADGTAPVLEWFDGLPGRAQDKLQSQNSKVGGSGSRVAPSEADLLRDGIYELRFALQHVNYRILYFFHGRVAAVLAHGLTKKDTVADKAIETALARKRKFEQDPALHTFEES